MAIKELSIVVRPKYEGAAITKGTKEQSAQVVEQGKQYEKLGRVMSKAMMQAAKEMGEVSHKTEEAEHKAVSFGEKFAKAVSSTPIGKLAKGVDHFTERVEKAQKSVLNLKNVILATAAGEIGKEFLSAGQGAARTERKMRLQFGDETFEKMEKQAKKIAAQSGASQEEALAAMKASERSIQDVGIGSMIKGKKITTEKEAEEAKDTLRGNYSALTSRLLTLNPEKSGEEIGTALAAAAQGPEGARMLASTFDLGKHASKVMAGIDNGKLQSVLTPEQKKKYGIKAGQKTMLSGDLLDLVLSSGGQSDKAAAGERETIGFDARLTKNHAEDLEAENAKSLFQSKNSTLHAGMKATRDSMDWANNHKTAIATAGGIYGALSIGGKLLGYGSGEGHGEGGGHGGLPGIPGGGEAAMLAKATGADKLLGDGAQRVHVVNFNDAPGGGPAGGAGGGAAAGFLGSKLSALGGWAKGGLGALATGASGMASGAAAAAGTTVAGLAAGIATAGAVGAGVGYGADKLTGKLTGRSISDRLAGVHNNGVVMQSDEDHYAPKLAKALASHAEAQHAASGGAGSREQTPNIDVHVTAMIDGTPLTAHVENKIARKMSTRTAGGVAPNSR